MHVVNPVDDTLDETRFRRFLHHASLTLLASLLIPLFVLLGLVLVLLDSSHRVDRSDQVIAEANNVEKLLVTMQSNFRGYRLTKEDVLRENYAVAHDAIGRSVDSLLQLVSDNAAQTATAQQIAADTRQWIQIADPTLTKILEGQTEESVKPAMTEARRLITAAVDRAHNFIEHERTVRVQRAERVQSVVTMLMAFFVGGACVGAPALALWLRQLLRKATASYQRSLSNSIRASQAKDDFIAALSHELRTPLTPVALSLTELKSNPTFSPPVRQQLSMMERNVALEVRLIDDLLDLSAVARGKLQLKAEPCDAHPLIELSIEIVEEAARVKGIVIQSALTARLTSFIGDPARFQQLIWNLLRNAVKFSPDHAKISITTRNEKNTVGAEQLVITVVDAGIGIESTQLAQIFQPFEQVANHKNHHFGGLGLGLAIARAVAEAHAGTLQASSDGLGRGATFTVTLPVTSSSSVSTTLSALPTEMSASPLNRRPQLRLLLIEDHENTRQVLQRMLETEGHQVLGVSNSADALAVADTHPFDLVISDLGLPDGTGNDLMAALSAKHGLRGVALSGYGMPEDIERSRQSGFVAHLVKPVKFDDLRRALLELPPPPLDGAR